MWVPYPLSDANQQIGDIKVSGDFASSGVYGPDGLYRRFCMPWREPSAANLRSVPGGAAGDFPAQLPLSEPKWNGDYAEYLQPTSADQRRDQVIGRPDHQGRVPIWKRPGGSTTDRETCFGTPQRVRSGRCASS